ncbi:MAG: hypothetical protein ABJ205_14300 [Erythrobacter sp.]|uniref:hypothetical protein n=1 Tax=Erythrobacter sp. TaxID=1042 RepID=UPI003265440F
MSGASLSAQENSEQTGQGFSPEDDLDCALYTAGLLASDDGVMTPDARTALIGTMTYFLGRYEAQRGTPISVALVERYPAYLEADSTQLEQICGLRARGFASRMEDMGRVMIEAEAQSSPNAPETP